MRILILNTQMEAGGAQKASLVLARGLMDHGHHVKIVSMYDKGDFIPLFNELYGVEIINLQMKTGKGIFANICAFLKGLHRLRRMMVNDKIEILQTFTHYSNVIGPIIGRIAHVPVRVSSQRNSLPDFPKWFRHLDKTVANSGFVQMMTVVSQGTYQYCVEEEGIKPNKLVTIYNGIDINRYSSNLTKDEKDSLYISLGLPENAVVITVVARLHPQKGHKYLIQAVPDIISAIPQAHFLFVGEGELYSQLMSVVKNKNLSSCVHFVGVRQDIPQILSISDLFILPSLYEGMPNALLEAMASGLPAVATRVDGTPELIVDGKTGFLVEPRKPAQLVAATLEILQNPDLAGSMGIYAKQRTENFFSIEKNISKYIQLYERLIAEELG